MSNKAVKISVAGNTVSGTPWAHLQIVAQLESGELKELEVQAGIFWNIYGDGNKNHNNQADTPGYGDFANYRIMQLDIGDRNPDDVWNILMQTSDSLERYSFGYQPTFNSNSYANTLLHSVGINVEDYFSIVTPPAATDGFLGWSSNATKLSLRSVELIIVGTEGKDIIVGGDWNDSLYGFTGNDIIRGGAGADVLCGNEVGPVGGPFDDEADILEGGAGKDTYFVGGEYSSGAEEERTVSFNPFEDFNRDIYEYIDVIKDIDGRGDIHVSTKAKGIDLILFEGVYKASLVRMGDYAGLALFKSTNPFDFSAVADRFVDPETGKTVYRLIFFDQEAGDAVFVLEDFRSGDFGIVVAGYDHREGTAGDDQALNNNAPGARTASSSPYNNIILDSAPSSDQRIHMGAGDDLAYGRGGDDDVRGEEGDDILYGGDGADNVEGGTGIDLLYGEDGNDRLDGGAGVDLLDGGDGDDEIQGGRGNDALQGGSGSDTYLYASGDGSDAIVEAADDAGADVLRLTDLNADDVTLSRNGANLLIAIDGTSQVIAIDGQFSLQADDRGIERIDFADGTSLDKEDIVSAVSTGGLPQATVIGTASAETLTGTGNDDVIWGKAGDDLLLGSAGSDTYIYASGDGSDYIDDEAGFTDNTDVLLLTDLNVDDVTLSRDGVHLLIAVNGTDEVITIDEQFYSNVDYWGMERIEFADGTSLDRDDIITAVSNGGLPEATVVGTASAETLTGTWQDDVLWGKAGDDLLLGDAGSDTYIYASGDGSDYIDDEAGFTENTDILLFTDLNADDVTLSQDGVHLLIAVNGTNQVITIDEQFYSEVDYWGIERIDFANGASLTRTQISDFFA